MASIATVEVIPDPKNGAIQLVANARHLRLAAPWLRVHTRNKTISDIDLSKGFTWTERSGTSISAELGSGSTVRMFVGPRTDDGNLGAQIGIEISNPPTSWAAVSLLAPVVGNGAVMVDPVPTDLADIEVVPPETRIDFWEGPGGLFRGEQRSTKGMSLVEWSVGISFGPEIAKTAALKARPVLDGR